MAADVGTIARTLERWMDEDQKDGDLKELQGLIWQEGFEKGRAQGSPAGERQCPGSDGGRQEQDQHNGNIEPLSHQMLG